MSEPSLPRTIAWAVALTATSTMAVSYVDRTTLAVLAPSVTRALHITNPEYGVLTAAFPAAYLIATPVAGWWIGRIGARRGLLRSLLAWSVIAALHALAPTLGVLLALRFALGVAEGPGFPGAAQTVHRVLPEPERARGFGVLFTGSSVGGMLAPILASVLYELGGWRVAFLGTAAVGLLWLVPWLLLTRDPAVRARLDLTGARPPRRTWRELRRVVTHPLMVRALIAIFAAAPVIGFVMFWAAKYLAATFGVTQGDVGFYLWLPSLALDAGALAFGDLASRLARAPGAPPRGLVGGGAVLAASLVLLPLAASPWGGIAVMSVAMAGGGALYTLVTADLLARVPDDLVSFAGGVLACAQSLALIVSSPLIGLATASGDYVGISLALGAWAVPGVLVWLAWRPAERLAL